MNSMMSAIGNVFSEMIRKPGRIMGTIFSLSVLFFMMFLLLMLVSFTLQSVEKAQSQISLTFYLKDDLPSYKEALLRAKLINMQNNNQISEYNYKTAAQTLEQFSASQPDRFQFLQQNLGDNVPLSPSFTIHPSTVDIESLIQFFLYGDFKDSIDTQRLAQSSGSIVQSKRVLEFLGFLKMGIIGIILLVLLGTSLVTASFISNSFTSRKNEVFIMRLVGATSNFIRLPFLIEAIFLTLFSLTLGWVVFFVLRYFALSEMITIFSSIEEKVSMAQSINAMWLEFVQFLPIMFFVILLFTVIATFITLERLLRRKDILGED